MRPVRAGREAGPPGARGTYRDGRWRLLLDWGSTLRSNLDMLPVVLVAQPLTFVDADGERGVLDRPFTFADYACAEPELCGQFTALPSEQQGHALPLAVYLDLEPSQRRNPLSFVSALDQDQCLIHLVPSQAMVAHTSSDRMHLWTTLQELGGLDNPFVRTAERRLRGAAHGREGRRSWRAAGPARGGVPRPEAGATGQSDPHPGRQTDRLDGVRDIPCAGGTPRQHPAGSAA
jgi:hypothetical protein